MSALRLAQRSMLVLAAVALASVPSALAAAQPGSGTLSMTSDTTSVPVGGTFRLEIVGSASGADMSDPITPDLSMFEVLSRQSYRPMSMRLGGGGMPVMVQSEVRVNFVLRARAPGTYALEPARMRVGGAELRSNPLTITVTGAGTPPVVGPPGTGNPPGTGVPAPPDPNAPGLGASPPSGALDGALYDDQAFLRTVVDRSEAVVGEQVTVTVYLYVRRPLTGSPMVSREPGTDGFWVYDLLGPTPTVAPTIQVVGSTRFQVYVLRRFAAFPLREGTLEISPMSLSVPQGSPIDIFMGTSTPDLERTGVGVSLTVRPLPSEGRPTASAEPHVGTLALSATLDRDQVPTGDAVTLTLTANGTGMTSALDPGDLVIDGVRVLTPQTDGETTSPGDRVSGTRRFEWLLVPEREGSFVVPAFRVPVYDPGTRTWSVAESAPLTLVAAGNPASPSGGSAEPEPGDPVALDDAPVEYGPVRTESELLRRRAHIASQAWYGWALGGVPVLFGFVLAARAIGRRLRARSEGDASAKAAREGRRRLADAEAKAKAGDARSFYAAVALALKSVIEGRLGESIGSLTHAELRKRMGERGMSADLAQKVVAELEATEFARFSASAAHASEMDASLVRARSLVAELDRFVATPLEDA